MIAIFICGYFLITIEHLIRIDKATIALLMGVLCWLIQFINDPTLSCGDSLTCLGEHLSSISQIIFFLLGALVIVELINVHKGFAIISDMIRMRSKRKLFWVVGFITFFMSAILDNLTTTIVMITLLRGLINEGEDRLLIGAGVVIAANAGGAWTPIGDVTTTMLWIGGQVSTLPVMRDLFLPSLISMIVVFTALSLFLKNDFTPKKINVSEKGLEPKGILIFFLGVIALISVPILKMLTGLPPFMGILLGLSVMWLVTDIVHRKHKDRDRLRVPSVLAHIDMSSLLFFLGILLAIDAMDAAKILQALAQWFNHYIGNENVIATLIGLASAIVDNVPLVAASMGMYTLEQYPQDHQFWQLIAFCAGTGGSILIIGSAAGVVYMGLEKVNFLWYLKRISLPALIGYFAGIATYLLF
ncbi:MAG: sodium:proton antiporter NhaD [Parachlamydiaceae bacterium]|nr:sodium:proton antiporter NhaD [Parachlamydiaceae bacterium]